MQTKVRTLLHSQSPSLPTFTDCRNVSLLFFHHFYTLLQWLSNAEYMKVSLQDCFHNFSIPIFCKAFLSRQACLFDKAMIDIDFSRSTFDNVPAIQ